MPEQPIPKKKRRLSTDELEAWKAFLRASQRVTLELDRDAEASGALLHTEHVTLITVAEAPEYGIRPMDLAELTSLTKSGLTRVLDRLERQGLIERRVCPSDGRGQLIVITAKGRRALRRAAPVHFRSVAAHFADLISPRELEVLTTAMRRVAEGAPAH